MRLTVIDVTKHALVFAFALALDPNLVNGEEQTREVLRDLAWLVGEWEHVNADDYHLVKNLQARWGKNDQTIEVNYEYVMNPGYEEGFNYKCSETISVSPEGTPIVSFNLKVVSARVFKSSESEYRGNYTLTVAKEHEWNGVGRYVSDRTRGEGEEAGRKTKLTMRKLSAKEFDLQTMAINNFAFRFRRIPLRPSKTDEGR